MANDVERTGIVGGGQMGAGIAEVCARAGLTVNVVELEGAAAQRAKERIRRSLDRAVERNKLEASERDAALGRVTVGTDVDALADCDLVIEAAPEDLAIKHEIFERLDRLVNPETILATNTSSLSIARIAVATSDPDRVIGLHFFNPAPVQPLVEVVPSLQTSEEVHVRTDRLAREVLGKTPITCPDRAGFVVNALLVPYLLNAIRMVEAGLASAEDVDTGMVNGCAHPMGPIALSDLVGLDTVLAVAEALHGELADPTCAPPPLLRRMVEAGRLGKKTGRGFYTYDTGP
ncbi:3-hydroxybutyryl-CoA dehydrogenase [Egibacter rhizosphaerae]|uniref:3-hydroxybutyryl-CoA dehydrogenase n=1 Tax=Egibacter rhizosphaerae TaxID=1670831 RepID=A0A411YBE1_9ACTN|nr:3-hydroxybutyryl-CoA dehydrogenase [Egibacter rhizosphaerae]QBI18520.1 3-hydroxybutyryl-CoA dehydrogenase [Egibacter rhizosphaerae]